MNAFDKGRDSSRDVHVMSTSTTTRESRVNIGTISRCTLVNWKVYTSIKGTDTAIGKSRNLMSVSHSGA